MVVDLLKLLAVGVGQADGELTPSDPAQRGVDLRHRLVHHALQEASHGQQRNGAGDAYCHDHAPVLAHLIGDQTHRRQLADPEREGGRAFPVEQVHLSRQIITDGTAVADAHGLADPPNARYGQLTAHGERRLRIALRGIHHEQGMIMVRQVLEQIPVQQPGGEGGHDDRVVHRAGSQGRAAEVELHLPVADADARHVILQHGAHVLHHRVRQREDGAARDAAR